MKNAPFRSLDHEKFSNNASEILLHHKRVEEFFESIGYDAEPHQGGFRGVCPACHSSCCYIGLNGDAHLIFWKCYDRKCPSHQRGCLFRRNLLGLVRGLMPDQSLGSAINTIAAFVGFEGRSFDVTNSNYTLGPSPR